MTRPALRAPLTLLTAPDLGGHGGMDVIPRARAHAERGRSRAAIELLKPDQAGRWGIAIDGWTSEFERDRLARALVSYPEPRRFLSLPAGAPEPADLPAVLDLRAKHSERGAARRRRADEAWEQSPEARAVRREEALWAAAAVLVALGAIGPLLALSIARVLSRDPWAPVAVGAGWSSFALASLLVAVDRWMKDRRLGASAWAGLAMAGVAAGCFLLAARWSAT